ncbi:MAG: helix-turn-helix domain-containing protein [Oryzomonas sp.]
MNIGENIRRFRKEGGYTQKQLAGIMGVKESYISALERGQRRPGNKILPLLCDALGVDEWAILFGTRDVHGLMLSPDEITLLIATAGLSTKQMRSLLQFIKKMKEYGECARFSFRFQPSKFNKIYRRCEHLLCRLGRDALKRKAKGKAIKDVKTAAYPLRFHTSFLGAN